MLTEFFTAVFGGAYLFGKYAKGVINDAHYHKEQIDWILETGRFTREYTNRDVEVKIRAKLQCMKPREVSSFINDFAGKEYDEYLCEFSDLESKRLCKNRKNALRVMLAQEGYVPTLEAEDLFRARLWMYTPEALLYYYAVEELKKKRPEFGYIFVLERDNLTTKLYDLIEFDPAQVKYYQYCLTGHFGFGTRLDPPLW